MELAIDAQRVFCHEYGHFISQTINKENYHGHGCGELSIYPHEHDKNRYKGYATPIKPDGIENTNQFREKLAEKLAEYVHGCIFESIFLGEKNLDVCWSESGKGDTKQWASALSSHQKLAKNLALAMIVKEYYETLLTDGKIIELIKKNRDHCLIKHGEEYHANLIALTIESRSLLDGYRLVYCSFVDKLENCLCE